jgi:hypothetical protein
MSAIQETQPGDDLFILQEFHASPEGEPFAWATSRRFRVGERVRMVRFFQDSHYKDHPGLGWTVVFDAANGKRYTATDSYFVNEECWQGLKKFFARRLLREPRTRPTPKP